MFLFNRLRKLASAIVPSTAIPSTSTAAPSASAAVPSVSAEALLNSIQTGNLVELTQLINQLIKEPEYLANKKPENKSLDVQQAFLTFVQNNKNSDFIEPIFALIHTTFNKSNYIEFDPLSEAFKQKDFETAKALYNSLKKKIASKKPDASNSFFNPYIPDDHISYLNKILDIFFEKSIDSKDQDLTNFILELKSLTERILEIIKSCDNIRSSFLDEYMERNGLKKVYQLYIKAYLEKGLDPNIGTMEGRSAYELSLRATSKPSDNEIAIPPPLNATSLLGVCVRFRDIELINLLLEKGAHPDASKETALRLAIFDVGPALDMQLIQRLIDCGASLNPSYPRYNDLLETLQNGQNFPAAFSLFIENGAIPRGPEPLRQYLKRCAQQFAQTQIINPNEIKLIEILLSVGPKPDQNCTILQDLYDLRAWHLFRLLDVNYYIRNVLEAVRKSQRDNNETETLPTPGMLGAICPISENIFEKSGIRTPVHILGAAKHILSRINANTTLIEYLEKELNRVGENDPNEKNVKDFVDALKLQNITCAALIEKYNTLLNNGLTPSEFGKYKVMAANQADESLHEYKGLYGKNKKGKLQSLGGLPDEVLVEIMKTRFKDTDFFKDKSILPAYKAFVFNVAAESAKPINNVQDNLNSDKPRI